MTEEEIKVAANLIEKRNECAKLRDWFLKINTSHLDAMGDNLLSSITTMLGVRREELNEELRHFIAERLARRHVELSEKVKSLMRGD